MNSTRRKWFLNPDEAAPGDQSAPAPAPVPTPTPVVERSALELVTLAVGAAAIGGSRWYGARPAMPRRNSGRWPA
ncbi:hypothetical protein BDK92_6400 [Micromonospora pisi]|uniref:Uncharacterized protein n=1 Tax=Micromonospora pisi TaxID=589240 RepID=A0A495JV05_9ACTN|nr:hypothetical protein [Micromonospora pisi]RKR91969.1 hypothetical protein BDK92_6400 [Micromonospora pisi]